jgi:hypothetical protein
MNNEKMSKINKIQKEIDNAIKNLIFNNRDLELATEMYAKEKRDWNYEYNSEKCGYVFELDKKKFCESYTKGSDYNIIYTFTDTSNFTENVTVNDILTARIAFYNMITDGDTIEHIVDGADTILGAIREL